MSAATPMSAATLPPPTTRAGRPPADRSDSASSPARTLMNGTSPAGAAVGSVFTPPPPGPPRLDGNSNGMLLTPDQFDAVEDYDPDYSYELLLGVVVVSPVPTGAHEAGIDELGAELRLYQRTPAGVAINDTLPGRHVRTSAGRRRADRVIWCGLGRQPDPTRDVPQIVCEFVSPRRRDRTRDYITKRAEYREAGVLEYWVFDRFRRTMTVCFADGRSVVVAEAGTYTTGLLPDFELPLAPILAAADRWAEEDAEGEETGGDAVS